MTPQERLAQARNKTRAKRDELNAIRREGSDLKRRLSSTQGSDADLRELARLGSESDRLQAEYSELQAAEAEALRGLNGRSNYGSMGVLSDPETVATLEGWATTSAQLQNTNIGEILSREETVHLTGRAVGGPFAALTPGQVTPTDQMQTGPFAGIVPLLQASLTFLDMIPTVPMDVPIIPYAREVPGSGEGAGPVAHGAVKPAAPFDYEDDQAPARTVAHFTKVPQQNLADIPGLEQTIQQRLIYGVLRALEGQVISGDGTGQQLIGILETTGIGDVPFAAGQPADLVLQGVVDVLVSGARPNVSALHPVDWAAMISAKASGSGEYIGAGPFAAAAQSLWQTVPVPSLGIPQGSALVGDTRLGARLHVREGVHVVVGQEQDDMTRNRVTLLGEGRWAVTVDQPAAWALVHLEAA